MHRPKNVTENVKDTRPRNINVTDLKNYQWPITAVASMPHRLAGLLIIFCIPLILCALDQSLASQESFNHLKECLSSPIAKLVTWVILSALLFHLVAGIKHLILDTGLGETNEGGKILAVGTLVISAALIAAAGVWIW